jgi:hypothetical protein
MIKIIKENKTQMIIKTRFGYIKISTYCGNYDKVECYSENPQLLEEIDLIKSTIGKIDLHKDKSTNEKYYKDEVMK